MVQLDLTDDFKRQALQWDSTTVHMKGPSSFFGKYNLNKRKMRKVVMQTAEPASTREATGWMVKIIDITYAKADLNQVSNNGAQLNAKERTLLLSILEDFKDLFDGNLVYWDTEPVNLDLKPGSKPFKSR